MNLMRGLQIFTLIFLPALSLTYGQEVSGNPALTHKTRPSALSDAYARIDPGKLPLRL